VTHENICKFITPSLPDALTVSCFILETDPDVICRTCQLSCHRAILVVQGEGRFHFDSTETVFAPGMLVFGFKGETFTTVCRGSCEYLYIGFDGTRAEAMFRRFHITAQLRSFPGFDGLIPLWSESLSRASQQTIDLASESMLLYAFSRLSGSTAERNGLISQIVRLSEERFSDPDFSVTTVAETLGYNVKYISHVFKEKMGVGYSEYLRTLRIKFAVSLFDHGIDTVKNVALLSGFHDPLYFSTVFKKELGLSPKDYCSRSSARPSKP